MIRRHGHQLEIFLNGEGSLPGIGRLSQFPFNRPKCLDRPAVHQVIIKGFGDHGLDQGYFHVDGGRGSAFLFPLVLVLFQVQRFKAAHDPVSKYLG